ncbi:hypothetical protein IFM89_007831, partial [Coptis chinensis]
GSILVKEGESDIGCLLAFKRDIQNAPQVFDTWVGNFTRCPYSWHGIDCNYGNYSVIGVTLEGLGLVGEVNLSALTGLRMLRSLSIARNQLSGQPFLGVGAFSFWSLESLDLSSNRFSGALPLSFLRVLVELDLSNNQFTGAIPRTFTISFFLRTVNLSQNYLTGELPSLGEFVGPDRSLPLQILDVSCNNITGPLTKSIGYYQSLRTLKLGNNGLSGKLPSELNMLTHLETLDLTKNDFSGTIPHSLKRFRSSFHPGNGMLRFPDSSARDSHGTGPDGLYIFTHQTMFPPEYDRPGPSDYPLGY